MTPQVEVSAIGDAFQFAPAKRILVLDVRAGLGIVAKLVLRTVVETQVCRLDPELRRIPGETLLAPVVKPLVIGAGFDEELHLHLLELPRAEDEITGRNLVAERLPDLSDAEGRLEAARLLDIEEVHEHALRGLRPQERHRRVFLDRADKSLEHQVELPSLGQVALQAFGTLALFPDRDLVGTEAPLAGAAVNQRIREPGHVSRGFPHPRMHEHGALEADHVLACRHHVAPPDLADVTFEFDAKRTVVPGAGKAPINLAGGEDKPTPLAQVDNLVHSHRHKPAALSFPPGGVNVSAAEKSCLFEKGP